jgi:hypothetical protein
MQISKQLIKFIEEDYVLEDDNGKYLLYKNMMPVFLDEIVDVLVVLGLKRIVIESASTDVLRGAFELFNNGWKLTGTNVRHDSLIDLDYRGIVFEKE